MNDYQNLKLKYLGENSQIKNILLSARIVQSQHKQKLKSLSQIKI